MERVIVIGCGGAGKSTFAVQLGATIGLPVIHLDREYWRPGWTQVPKDEFTARVRDLIAQPAWVIDGNYASTMRERADACDTIVFLDLPRWRCLMRVLYRTLKYFGRARTDMNPGCPERLPDWEFVRWILDYPKNQRPQVLALLAHVRDRKRVVVLGSQRAIDGFLQSVTVASAKSPAL